MGRINPKQQKEKYLLFKGKVVNQKKNYQPYCNLLIIILKQFFGENSTLSKLIFRSGVLINLSNRKNIILTVSNPFFDEDKKYLQSQCAIVRNINKGSNERILLKNKHFLGQKYKFDTLIAVNATKQVFKNVLQYGQGFKINFNLADLKDYSDIFIIGCSEQLNRQQLKQQFEDIKYAYKISHYQYKIEVRHIHGKSIFYEGSYQIDDGFSGSPIIKKIYNKQLQKDQYHLIGIHLGISRSKLYKFDPKLNLFEGISLIQINQMLQQIFDFELENQEKEYIQKAITLQSINKKQMERQKYNNYNLNGKQSIVNNLTISDSPCNSIAILRYEFVAKNIVQKSFGLGVLVKHSQNKFFIATCFSNILYQRKFKQFEILLPQFQRKNPYQQCQIQDYFQIIYQDKFFQCTDQFLKLHYQIVLVDLNSQGFKLNQNQGVDILFDYNNITNKEVYLFSYTYKQFKESLKGQKTIQLDMSQNQTQRQQKYQYPILKRLIEITSQDSQYIYYKAQTDVGECGGGIFVRKDQKFYLIGLHIGKYIGKDKNGQLNCGVLFSNRVKQDLDKKISQKYSSTQKQKFYYYQKMQQEEQDQQLNKMMGELSLKNKREILKSDKQIFFVELDQIVNNNSISNLSEQTLPIHNIVGILNYENYFDNPKNIEYLGGSGIIISINKQQFLLTLKDIAVNCNEMTQIFTYNYLITPQGSKYQRQKLTLKKVYENSKQNVSISKFQRSKNSLLNRNYEIKFINKFDQIMSLNSIILVGYTYQFSESLKKTIPIVIFHNKINFIEELMKDFPFIYFNNTTYQGEGGGAFLIEMEGKRMVIGMHLGVKYVQKLGYLNYGIIFDDSFAYQFKDIFYPNDTQMNIQIRKQLQKNVFNNFFKQFENQARFLSLDEQKYSPFQNAVLLRMTSPQSKQYKFFIGSGVIVKYKNKRFIATLKYNLFYKQKFSSKAYAFLNVSNIRTKRKMQIKEKMIKLQEKSYNGKQQRGEIIFIEIQQESQALLDVDIGLQIQFDWRIPNQKVFIMGFLFNSNKQKLQKDINDLENSQEPFLLCSKLQLQKIQNKFLRYQHVRQLGLSGSPIFVRRKEKYFLIAIHIGHQQKFEINGGKLFTSQLKGRFPQIFLKRQSSIQQERDTKNESNNKILIKQNDNGEMYRQKKIDNKIQRDKSLKQFQQKAIKDFFDYVFQLYNSLDKNGRQSRTAKQWQQYFQKLLNQVNSRLSFLQKDKKYTEILYQIRTKLKQQRNKFSSLRYIPDRNYEVSDSTIAKVLRISILPLTKQLAQLSQVDIKVNIKDLKQTYNSYGWVFCPGGIKYPYVHT